MKLVASCRIEPKLLPNNPMDKVRERLSMLRRDQLALVASIEFSNGRRLLGSVRQGGWNNRFGSLEKNTQTSLLVSPDIHHPINPVFISHHSKSIAP